MWRCIINSLYASNYNDSQSESSLLHCTQTCIYTMLQNRKLPPKCDTVYNCKSNLKLQNCFSSSFTSSSSFRLLWVESTLRFLPKLPQIFNAWMSDSAIWHLYFKHFWIPMETCLPRIVTQRKVSTCAWRDWPLSSLRLILISLIRVKLAGLNALNLTSNSDAAFWTWKSSLIDNDRTFLLEFWKPVTAVSHFWWDDHTTVHVIFIVFYESAFLFSLVSACIYDALMSV